MRSPSAVIAGIGVAAAAAAVWLYPHATPIIALDPTLTRAAALTRADSFFKTHALAPTGARTAVQFESDDSLRTFVELAGGGLDSLNALLRGDDVAPFTWSVRAFAPGNPRGAWVSFAPDGRIIGFERKLAETDKRPPVTADSGRRLAEQALDVWIDERAERWKLVAVSYETQQASGRIDRTYTFERNDRRIGGAPIRAEAVIAGDTPTRLRPFVEIPQSFQRRYADMRAWNQLLALLAGLSLLGITIAGGVALVRYGRRRQVRWREPLLIGSAIGGLILVAALNEMPGNWFSYNTAVSPATFMAVQVLFALMGGAATAALVGLTLAAAEAATRHAFPDQLDWWKLWRYRGTREVASLIGGGYVVAALALAYVAAFYLVTRTLLGWWAPAELLDNPNQIATPLPWVSGIAVSAQAAVWEEALSRALPLSLLAVWAGPRPTRRWWMAAGVVGSALIFGFAHSSYPSWPPYSRGVEIFLDACFWAFLFLRFGLLVTVVAHFTYDAVLFGLFAAAGDAAAYRISAGIIVLALLAPALAVLWRVARQRGFTSAPDDARFAAWTPLPAEEPVPAIQPRPSAAYPQGSRRVALAAAVAGLVVAVADPPAPTLGPEFTVPRGRVVQTADSLLRARGVDPAGWARLSRIGANSGEEWDRFVRRYQIEDEAERLASSIRPPAWWDVRYVHTAGSVADRAEEWKVRVWPDGRPLDVQHTIPDSATRGVADTAEVRRIAKAALLREGLDTSTLEETEFRERPRPARRDVRVTYRDTAITLPAKAAVRVGVDVAGDEPLLVWRWVELPEAFLRSDRSRQARSMLIAGVSLLLLTGLLITGVAVVRRRLPVAVYDGILGRETWLWLLGGLGVLAVLDYLNALPLQLYSYDTAQPWSTFVGTTALGLVATVIVALLLAGLWLVLQTLRRRVGIPLLDDEPSRAAAVNVLIAGAGIGGMVYGITLLDGLIPPGPLPSTPSSSLDQLVPWLAGIPGIPARAIGTVATMAIPILVVGGLTPRWRWRALMGLIMAMLVAAIAWPFVPVGDVRLARLPVLIAGLLGVVAAMVVWGRRSAWSWLVAALWYQALEGVHEAVYGPEWQARAGGALTVLVAVGLIALIGRSVGQSVRRSAVIARE